MRFFKKVFGYSIGFIRDKDAPPIESSISEKIVYVNLSRWREWDFYDFIFCVFHLFDDGPLLRINAAISAGKKLDRRNTFIKCIFLNWLATVCLCLRGLPFDLLSLCFTVSSFWIMWKSGELKDI